MIDSSNNLFSASNAQSDVTTTFSGAWDSNSPFFTRPADQRAMKRYYAVIEVNVSVTGSYLFTGTSRIHMAGHLHDGDFDPTDPDRNLISQAAKSDGPEQFRITARLQSDQRYVLVVRPRASETKGTFSIVSSGPAAVSLRTAKTMAITPVQGTGEYRFANSSVDPLRNGHGNS